MADDLGYFESAQQLVYQAGRSWTHLELLTAAETGALHNTGWPIGGVFKGGSLSPTPLQNGIEARILHDRNKGWDEYWQLQNDGSFYVARVFEEDPIGIVTQPSQRELWFDLQIWRIAEMILHSASLYKALGVAPNDAYLLAVNHHGLQGREFYASNGRRHIRRGNISRVSDSTWTREVTQDFVQTNYRDLIAEASQRLFVLFDFADVSRAFIDDVVDEFEKRRL